MIDDPRLVDPSLADTLLPATRSRRGAPAFLLLLAVGLGGPTVAWAQDDAPATDAPREEAPRRRHGLVDDEAIIKWSGQLLEEGGWVAGISLVAHGLNEDTTISTRTSEVLLGHYNARVRIRPAHRRDDVVTSFEGGAGIVTPVSFAAIAVADFDPPPVLATVDVSLPTTWTLATGRFLTVRPWLALGVGNVQEESLTDLPPVLLGRPAITGPGIAVTGEGHLARRIGVVTGVDVGLDLFGGNPALATNTRVAVVLAAGPVRANLGFGLLIGVDQTGSVQLGALPAVDIWARF